VLFDEYYYKPEDPAWWNLCKRKPRYQKCKSSWNRALNRTPVQEPCDEAVFVEKGQFRNITWGCNKGERPFLKVQHTRNNSLSPSGNLTRDTCYHDIYAHAYCHPSERLLHIKHMWGRSDCLTPRREDLNYAVTSGAVSWCWTLRSFQPSYFSTEVLNVAIVAWMEVMSKT